ncbi:hypothetical protein GYH30_033283 [Glycine max]|nr:hypothetical protein GYH30_033283 [Glycine max]
MGGSGSEPGGGAAESEQELPLQHLRALRGSRKAVYDIQIQKRKCLWKGRLRHGRFDSHAYEPSTIHVAEPSDIEALRSGVPLQNFGKEDFALATQEYGINGVLAIFNIGNRTGQARADFYASLNGLVQQFFQSLPMSVPLPFKHEESSVGVKGGDKGWQRGEVAVTQEDLGLLSERLKNHGFAESVSGNGGGSAEEEGDGRFNIGSIGLLGR